MPSIFNFSYLPNFDCHVPGATNYYVWGKENSTCDYVVVTGKDLFGLASLVVPDSERMVFTSSDHFLAILGKLNASDTATVSTEKVLSLDPEVSDTDLGNILIFCSSQEDSFIRLSILNGSDAINDI